MTTTDQPTQAWISFNGCIHLGDAHPAIDARDLSGQETTIPGLSHDDDTVSVELCGRMGVRGTLAQQQAFVTAYQAQLDKIRVTRSMADEQAGTPV